MEILLNELSLEGQYESVENFVSSALTPMLKVLKELTSYGQLLLKKEDLYKSKITTKKTLIDLIKTPLSVQRDEMSRLKSAIMKLTQTPFWENSTKQDANTTYTWKNEDIWGSSLAESIERDKVVISFLNSKFKHKNIEVFKGDKSIQIENLCNKGDLTELLWEKNEIVFSEYVINHFQGGKLNFSKMIDLENFQKIEVKDQKLFLDTFRKFEELPWNQIIRDQGLCYKSYKDELPGFFGNQNTDKFRASRKIRCHGYREKDIFYALFLEIDHSISDEG